MRYNTALVIGAGAFGTSMASILSHNFKKVILKVRSDDVYDCLKNGENSIYLPGVRLGRNIVGAKSWDEVDSLVEGNIEILVSGLPSSAIKKYCEENESILRKYLSQEVPFVSLSKGIDPDTLELPDDVLFDFFPEYRDQFLFLSGPSFAREIVEKQITVVSLAGRSRKYLVDVGRMSQTDYFKVFKTYDIKGVLLGGALKNIIAIAGGFVEGLGYNHNTRAALITRGIAEMLSFGKVLNARPETFYGLSGMGDLILTTTGGLSRNKLFGQELARGRKPEDILKSQRAVVEGYKTAKAAYLLAKKYDIRCLIFTGVYQALYEGKDPKSIIKSIMRLPPTFEIE